LPEENYEAIQVDGVGFDEEEDDEILRFNSKDAGWDV